MLESLYDVIGFHQLIAPVNVPDTSVRYSASLPTATVKNALIIVKRYGAATNLFTMMKLQFSTAPSSEGTTAPTGAADIPGAAYSTSELAVSGTFNAATGDGSIIMFDIDLEAASQQTLSINASSYTHINLSYQLGATGTNTIYAVALTGPQRYSHKAVSFTSPDTVFLHVKKIG